MRSHRRRGRRVRMAARGARESEPPRPGSAGSVVWGSADDPSTFAGVRDFKEYEDESFPVLGLDHDEDQDLEGVMELLPLEWNTILLGATEYAGVMPSAEEGLTAAHI